MKIDRLIPAAVMVLLLPLVAVRLPRLTLGVSNAVAGMARDPEARRLANYGDCSGILTGTCKPRSCAWCRSTAAS